MGQRGRPRHPDVLTPREWEVLDHIAAGRSNDEIATAMGISLAGVKFHVSSILSKLGVASRHEAAVLRRSGGQRAGLVGAFGLWRASMRRVALVAGAAATVMVFIVVAVLAWGIYLTRTTGGDRDTPTLVRAAATPTPTPWGCAGSPVRELVGLMAVDVPAPLEFDLRGGDCVDVLTTSDAGHTEPVRVLYAVEVLRDRGRVEFSGQPRGDITIAVPMDAYRLIEDTLRSGQQLFARPSN